MRALGRIQCDLALAVRADLGRGLLGRFLLFVRFLHLVHRLNDTEQNEVAVGQRTSVTVGGRVAHFLPNNTTAVTVPTTANVDPRLWVCKFAA